MWFHTALFSEGVARRTGFPFLCLLVHLLEDDPKVHFSKGIQVFLAIKSRDLDSSCALRVCVLCTRRIIAEEFPVCPGSSSFPLGLGQSILLLCAFPYREQTASVSALYS